MEKEYTLTISTTITANSPEEALKQFWEYIDDAENHNVEIEEESE